MAEATNQRISKSCPNDQATQLPKKEDCIYTACYCEENVWQLCQHVRLRAHETGDERALNQSYAVFISNHHKQIPIWHQGASSQPEGLVIWDYHVIFVTNHLSSENADTRNTRYHVYDLDTTLAFPCELEVYVKHAIRSEETLLPKYRRLFRVIPASQFLDTFASDRSHMLKDDGVTYMATPPQYPPIRTQRSKNNISEFISMQSDTSYGTVLNSNQFLNKFSYRTS